MSVIPVTSTMCLGRPPGTPIPKAEALAFMQRQESYLQGRPPIKDLIEVWLPWSWNLVNPNSKRPPFTIWGEAVIRSTCLSLHKELLKIVQAREEDT